MQLNCKNCGQEFNVVDSQYKYQENRKPGRDWFCSRSCTTTCSNLHKRSEEHREANADHMRSLQVEASKRGSTTLTKHNQQFVWYVSRSCYDGRFGTQTLEWKQEFAQQLEELWEECGGRCAFTGIQLHLRNRRGKADTQNTFLIASIDRIDSSKPYERGNVQWVSCGLNLAKGNVDNNTFLASLSTFLSLTSVGSDVQLDC
jgi:hypothetical protein